MTAKGFTGAGGLAAALVALLAFASPGVADEDAKPAAEAAPVQEAGPGDPVRFSIPDTVKDDRYAVYLEGQLVAQGTDQDNSRGVQGVFSMPALGGDSRIVVMRTSVFPADGGPSRTTEEQVRYRAPAPAPQPPPAPAPHGDPAPPAPPPAATLEVVPRDDGPFAIGGVIREGFQETRGAVLGRRADSLAAPRKPTAGKRAKAKSRKATRKKKRTRRHREKRFPVPGATKEKAPPVDPPEPDDRLGEPAPFPGVGYSVAWPLLLAVALGGLLLAAALGTRARRTRQLMIRREIPPFGELEGDLDAELEQLVASEREHSRV